MKYDFYFQRLEALWQRRKRWIVGLAFLVVGIGVATRIWPKSQEEKIKYAISKWHKGKGQALSLEILDFKLVDGTYIDSVILENIQKKREHYEKWYKKWSGMAREAYITKISIESGAARRNDILVSKARETYSEIESDKQKMLDSTMLMLDSLKTLNERISANKGKIPQLTRCTYIANIRTATERYTDTLTVVLDDKLNVVWPDRK